MGNLVCFQSLVDLDLEDKLWEYIYKFQEKIKYVTSNNNNIIGTLMRIMGIYSQDICLELGIEKCTILIMKRGKRETIEGIELSNQERIRTLGKMENFKYSGKLEADTIKRR